MSEQVSKSFEATFLVPSVMGGKAIQSGRVVHESDYDALHAEAEALRAALLGIASVNPAERGIEWAKSYASDGLKGAGSELYARWLDTFKEAEALRAENERLSQQLAQSDSALRESRANDMANVRTLEDMWERHDALRQELEVARGLPDHIERHLTMAEQGERQEAVAPYALSKHYSEIDRLRAAADFNDDVPVIGG